MSIYVRHDLFFGQEFNTPDTYVQTVKLVIESQFLIAHHCPRDCEQILER